MKFTAFQFSLYVVLLAACASTTHRDGQEGNLPVVQEGTWRMTLSLGSEVLPFTAEWERKKQSEIIVIRNAEERIDVPLTRRRADTLIFEMPVFNSTLFLHVESPDLITGFWQDFDRDDYRLPLIAEHDKPFRFTPSKSTTKLSPRYKVRFGGTEGYNAILLVENKDGHLTGTFLTETGDYRYLEGNIMNGKINLSTFDGSHAFLFDALINGDSLTNGRFFSGSHYTNHWEAAADSTFELKDPKVLTHLRDDCEEFSFSLLNQDGNQVDETHFVDGNTVVVYDIMGSWCPNCSDASLAIDQIAANIGKERVKIVPIAFERTTNLEEARRRIYKMQDDLGLERGFIFGGKADKKNVGEALPCISQLISFPTFIVVDKGGKISATYTGFYGPGTGSYYSAFMEEMEYLLKRLSER